MISGESKVHLLSDLSCGTPLGSLAKLNGDGPIYVFTSTSEKITVGVIEAIVPGGTAWVYSVTLDDGAVLKATDDQEFILLDGSALRLSDLKVGMSLMPLYLSFDKHGYPNYRENSTYNIGGNTTIDCQKVRKVSRMVAEFKTGDRLVPNTHVTYVDGNRKNCHPSNLQVTHKSDTKPRKFIHPHIKALKDAQKFIESHPKNHKVMQISVGQQEPVYDCIMPLSDNLAVDGVFLRSTKDE